MIAAEVTTTLVRPVETMLVFLGPIEFAGFDGPDTPAEGIALFEKYDSINPMTVGSSGHDPELPVALLLHRDGSAPTSGSVRSRSPRPRTRG